MDFEKLVATLLCEADPSGGAVAALAPMASTSPATAAPAAAAAAPTTPSSTETATTEDDEVVATNVKTFLAKKKGELKTTYDVLFKHLGVSVFPEAEFDTIVYTVSKNSVRSTKDPNQVPNFQYAYPLIDLAAMVKQSYLEPIATSPGKKPDPKDKEANAEKAYDSFIERLKKSKIQYPLDYRAVDPWAISVKEAYMKLGAKLDIGKLKLDAYKTVSIENVINELLKQKASVGLRKLKPETFQPSTKKTPAFVRNIILHPENYTSGTVPYPDIKMSAIYGSDIPARILAIAVATRALFDQQFREKVIRKKLFDPKIEVRPGLLAEKLSFEEIYEELFQSLTEASSRDIPRVDIEISNKGVHTFTFEYTENQHPVTYVIKDLTDQKEVFRAYGPLALAKMFSLVGWGEGRKKKVFPDLTDEEIDNLLNPSAQGQLTDKPQQPTTGPQSDQPTKDIMPNLQSPEMLGLYEKFITNSLEWSKDALIVTNASSETPKSNNTVPSKESLSKYRENVEQEYVKAQEHEDMIKDVARKFASNPYIEQKPVEVPVEPSAKPSEETPTPESSEGTDESFIEGKYTVSDIQKYKDKNDDAKRLYGLLEDFANFIRGSFDWDKALSGATSFAKSLAALGGPSVGGKR
jgi:hypothetical protein